VPQRAAPVWVNREATSDYQKPRLDSAGHDGTVLVASSGTSRRYVLVPDVDSRFG